MWVVFCCKQKTAYEMRISDWSSDVCSSDLLRGEIARVREMLDHRLLDEVEDLGPATIENLCAFIRKQLEDSVTSLCAVMVERRLSGDRCVLRWTRSSDERRVGIECVRRCRSVWSPLHEK